MPKNATQWSAECAQRGVRIGDVADGQLPVLVCLRFAAVPVGDVQVFDGAASCQEGPR